MKVVRVLRKFCTMQGNSCRDNQQHPNNSGDEEQLNGSDPPNGEGTRELVMAYLITEGVINTRLPFPGWAFHWRLCWLG